MKLIKLFSLISASYFSTLEVTRADDNLYLQNLNGTAERGLTEVAAAMKFHGISVAIGFACIGIGIAVGGYSIGRGISRKGG